MRAYIYNRGTDIEEEPRCRKWARISRLVEAVAETDEA